MKYVNVKNNPNPVKSITNIGLLVFLLVLALKTIGAFAPKTVASGVGETWVSEVG